MSVNRVLLLGRLGADPRMHLSHSGVPLAIIIVGARRSRNKTPAGTPQAVDWHRVVCWGSLAELVGLHLRRGRQVFVEGELRTKQYRCRDGQMRRTGEIKAWHVTFCGGLGGDEPVLDLTIDDPEAVGYLLNEQGPVEEALTIADVT